MQQELRLDMEALEELKAVMEGEFHVLLSTFVQDAADRLHDIEMAKDNWQRLRRAAHSFKGSSSNVGALALCARCRDLEAHCQRAEASDEPIDDGTTSDRLIRAIRIELDATAAAIRDEFGID